MYVELKANFYISVHLQWLVKLGHLHLYFQGHELGGGTSF